MSEPREGHLEVARTARYWAVGGEGAADVWFVLHGYRQLAGRFLKRFQHLAGDSRLVVAPEGLSRFYVEEQLGRHGPGSVVGAAWMTREDREHEIADYVRYLDRLADRILAAAAPGARVTVLGFSQGVATATRWTALGRIRPVRLIAWGDFLPEDLAPDVARAAWSDLELVRVRGERDPIFGNGARGEAEARFLVAAGISSRVVSFSGGHETDPRLLTELAGAAPAP